MVRDTAALGGEGCAHWCLLRLALAGCMRRTGQGAAAAQVVAAVTPFLEQMDKEDALYPMVRAGIMLDAVFAAADAAGAVAALSEYAGLVIPAAAKEDYPLAGHASVLAAVASNFGDAGKQVRQALLEALLQEGVDSPVVVELLSDLPELLHPAPGQQARDRVAQLAALALSAIRVTDELAGPVLAGITAAAVRFCDSKADEIALLRQMLSLASGQIAGAPRDIIGLQSMLVSLTVVEKYYPPGLLLMLDTANLFLQSKGVPVAAGLRLNVLLPCLQIRGALPRSWVDVDETLALAAELIDAEELPEAAQETTYFAVSVTLEQLGNDGALELLQRLFGKVVRTFGRFSPAATSVRMLLASLYHELQQFEQARVIWQGAVDQFRQAADAAQAGGAAREQACLAARGVVMLYLSATKKLLDSDQGRKLVHTMAVDAPAALVALASTDDSEYSSLCCLCVTALLNLDGYDVNSGAFVEAVAATLQSRAPLPVAAGSRLLAALAPALQQGIGGIAGSASIAAALLPRLPSLLSSQTEQLFYTACVVLPALSQCTDTVEHVPVVLSAIHRALLSAMPSESVTVQLSAIRGIAQAAFSLLFLGKLELLDDVLTTVWTALQPLFAAVADLPLVALSGALALSRICADSLRRCAASDGMLQVIRVLAGRPDTLAALGLISESAAVVMASCGRQDEWAELADELQLPATSRSKRSAAVELKVTLALLVKRHWEETGMLLAWNTSIRGGCAPAAADDVSEVASFCAASLPEGKLPVGKMCSAKALPPYSAQQVWLSMVVEGATAFRRPLLPLRGRAPLLRELCLKLTAAARVDGGATLWLHGRACVGKTQLARAAAQALWMTDAFDAIVELAALHPLPLLPSFTALQSVSTLLLLADEGVPPTYVELLRSRVSRTVVLMVCSSPPPAAEGVVAIAVPPLPAATVPHRAVGPTLVTDTAVQGVKDAWQALCAAEPEMAALAPRLCALGSQAHSEQLLDEVIGARQRGALAVRGLLAVTCGEWQALPSLLVEQLAASCSDEQLADGRQQLADARARLLAGIVELSLVQPQPARRLLVAQLPGLLAAALRGEAAGTELARHPVLVVSAAVNSLRQPLRKLAVSWPSEEEGGLPLAVRSRLLNVFALFYERAGSDDAPDDAVVQAAISEGAETAAQAVGLASMRLPVVRCLQRELLASPGRVARIGAHAAWLQARILGDVPETQAAYAAVQLTMAAMRALGVEGGEDLMLAVKAFVEGKAAERHGESDGDGGKSDDVPSAWEAARAAVGELDLPDAFPLEDVPAEDVQLLRASTSLLAAFLTDADKAMQVMQGSLDQLVASPLLCNFLFALLLAFYPASPPECVVRSMPLLERRVLAEHEETSLLFTEFLLMLQGLNLRRRFDDSVLVGPVVLDAELSPLMWQNLAMSARHEPLIRDERLLAVSAKLGLLSFQAPMGAEWEAVVLHAIMGRDTRTHLQVLTERSTSAKLGVALADALLCEGKEAEDALAAVEEALIGTDLFRVPFAVTLTALQKLSERRLDIADAALQLLQIAGRMNAPLAPAMELLAGSRTLPTATAALLQPEGGFTADNIAASCLLLNMLWKRAALLADVPVMQQLLEVGAAALPTAIGATADCLRSVFLDFILRAVAVVFQSRYALPDSTHELAGSLLLQLGRSVGGTLAAVLPGSKLASQLASLAAHGASKLPRAKAELTAIALNTMALVPPSMTAGTLALHVADAAKAAGLEAELFALLDKAIARAPPVVASLLGKVSACLATLYEEGFEAMVLSSIASDDADDEQLQQLRLLAVAAAPALPGKSEQRAKRQRALHVAAALCSMEGKSAHDLRNAATMKKVLAGSWLLQVAIKGQDKQTDIMSLPAPMPTALTSRQEQFVLDVLTGKVV
eukprot:PLAT12481.5.p1 GENE.PLAT12481.5~~PLAT12481.5.p1  ORF type:complete len:2110 (-),score=770.09 PLAT12481.5:787-6456(-)